MPREEVLKGPIRQGPTPPAHLPILKKITKNKNSKQLLRQNGYKHRPSYSKGMRSDDRNHCKEIQNNSKEAAEGNPTAGRC